MTADLKASVMAAEMVLRMAATMVVLMVDW